MARKYNFGNSKEERLKMAKMTEDELRRYLREETRSDDTLYRVHGRHVKRKIMDHQNHKNGIILPSEG